MSKNYLRIWNRSEEFWIKLEQFSFLSSLPPSFLSFFLFLSYFCSFLSFLFLPLSFCRSANLLLDGKSFAALVAFLDSSVMSSSQVKKMGTKPKSDLKKALLSAEKLVCVLFEFSFFCPFCSFFFFLSYSLPPISCKGNRSSP